MNIEQYKQVLLQYCDLNHSEPVVVGVSGGADSLCLLDVLVRLKFPVIAAHFNHHLRPESGEDARFVLQVAELAGIPFVLGEADIAKRAQENSESLEEAARICRYRFLYEQARLSRAQAVAVGHTADDQVETVLMNLIRGSGLTGLAGMTYRSLNPAWDTQIPLVRPLLGAWRTETQAYCRERSLPFVTDATNFDRAYFRNRVRLDLIPTLETYNPQVKDALWRMANVVAGEEGLLKQAVATAWDACLVEQKAGALVFYLARLRHQPNPMQRALLRKAVEELRQSLKEVGYADIERALAFVHSRSKSGQMDWMQGLWCWRQPALDGQDQLWIAEKKWREPGLVDASYPQLAGAGEVVLEVPGSTRLGNAWELSSEWVEERNLFPNFASTAPDACEAWLDADALLSPLILRRPRAGDRFCPQGMQGRSQKLSDFWINRKIPRQARANWPLVCCGVEPAWVAGLRLSNSFCITAKTRRALRLVLRKK